MGKGGAYRLPDDRTLRQRCQDFGALLQRPPRSRWLPHAVRLTVGLCTAAAEDHSWLCGGGLAVAAGLLLTRAPYAPWLRGLIKTPPPVWIYGLVVAALGLAYGWRERRLAREESALAERRLAAQLRETREELREARRYRLRANFCWNDRFSVLLPVEKSAVSIESLSSTLIVSED